MVSQQIGVLGGSTPCFPEGPGSFLQVILGYQALRRQRQGDDAHIRPQLLSGASLKESRSGGRQGLLVRGEMAARWQRSGFRAKARGGVGTCLRTHPSNCTIMSGGKTRSASLCPDESFYNFLICSSSARLGTPLSAAAAAAFIWWSIDP